MRKSSECLGVAVCNGLGAEGLVRTSACDVVAGHDGGTHVVKPADANLLIAGDRGDLLDLFLAWGELLRGTDYLHASGYQFGGIGIIRDDQALLLSCQS